MQASTGIVGVNVFGMHKVQLLAYSDKLPKNYVIPTVPSYQAKNKFKNNSRKKQKKNYRAKSYKVGRWRGKISAGPIRKI